MKLTFHLNTTLYDCILRLRGEGGFAADYRMTATAPLGSALMDCVTVEVPVDTCEVTVCPQYSEELREEVKGFQGGGGFWANLAAKTLGKIADTGLRSFTLHTALTYRLDLKNRLGQDVAGDGTLHLTLTERNYTPTSKTSSEIFELLPVYYTFFELAEGETALSPVRAEGVNRTRFRRLARKLILLQCMGWFVGILGLLGYPFMMGRVKHLTRDRLVLRCLRKLYRMHPAERAYAFESDSVDEFGEVYGKL